MMELRQELSETALKSRISKFHPLIIAGVALAAILFQVLVPRISGFFSYVEMPLLITVYFTLMRRSQIAGVAVGAFVGLAQDAVSQNQLGIFGITKTLAGYLAASLSQRFDVDNPAVRGILGALFFALHQLFLWFLRQIVLGQVADLAPLQVLLAAILNGLLAIPLFALLDKLRLRA